MAPAVTEDLVKAGAIGMLGLVRCGVNRQVPWALTSNLLMKYRLVRVQSIELDDMMQEVNTFISSLAFVTMLIFIRVMLDEDWAFYWYM